MDHLNDRVTAHMRTDFARLRVDQTVAEALDAIRQSAVGGRIVYFYVLDADGRLHGVIPTRALLLSPPEARLNELMVKRVISVPPDARLLDVCDLFVLHRLLAFPVVDGDGRMIGVIDVEHYTDELLQLGDREINDDVFQLIGVRLAKIRKASVPQVVRFRFPWLLCNIGGGLLCAILSRRFEWVLAEVITLALFIPVVLALAESVSIQTLTLTLQSHHGTRSDWRRWFGELAAEAPVGLLLGLGTGAIVGGAAWLWLGAPAVGLTVAASIAAAVAVAAVLGIAVPAILWSMQRDPRVASGPIALALTDLATLTIYFGLAAALLTG